MPLEYISNMHDLHGKLEQSGSPYLIDRELPCSEVELRFAGRFEGSEVVWNARIVTLEEYAKYHPVPDDPVQFIDIQRIDGIFRLEVGLNIKQIDQPAIERTIIMIRKYKRLQLGRHEYGARSKTL